jgi:hypothetical protein
MATLGTGAEFVGPVREGPGGRYRADQLHSNVNAYVVYDYATRAYLVDGKRQTIHFPTALEADRNALRKAGIKDQEPVGDNWDLGAAEGAHVAAPVNGINQKIDLALWAAAPYCSTQTGGPPAVLLFKENGYVTYVCAGERQHGPRVARRMEEKSFLKWFKPLPFDQLRATAEIVRESARMVGGTAYVWEALRRILNLDDVKKQKEHPQMAKAATKPPAGPGKNAKKEPAAAAPEPVVKKKAGGTPPIPKKHAYDDGAKIKVLNKENPHRAESGRAEAFDAMLGCKTAGEYYATGKKPKYLGDWVKSEHITVG